MQTIQFRIQDSGFEGLGCRIQGSGFWIQGADLHLGAGVLGDLDDGVHNVLALVHPGAAKRSRLEYNYFAEM